jgi:hypothetical protein
MKSPETTSAPRSELERKVVTWAFEFGVSGLRVSVQGSGFRV